MNLINRTPFAAASFILLDQRGCDTLLIVIKGSWRIRMDGTLSIAEKQAPINTEPVYSDAPGASSLVHDTDLCLQKAGTDCALIGHAWALKRGTRSTEIRFAVGALQKSVRVFGDRAWTRRIGRASLSQPAQFDKIPLVFERAFGGRDSSRPCREDHEYCLENPVGRGFMARKSHLDIEHLPVPNLEDPHHLIQKPSDRPPPAGFGMIPPYWHPRVSFCGTHNERWRRTVCPLPPEDQDPRFYSCATRGLTAGVFLDGAEQVLVEGASVQGRLLFNLPGVAPRATVRRRAGVEEPHLRLDTVVVQPDDQQLVLTWRGSVPVPGRCHDLLQARVDF